MPQAQRDKLADLIASSATFRTLAGLATEAAAKSRVYQVSAPDPGFDHAQGYTRPYALVWTGEQYDWHGGGYGAGVTRWGLEADTPVDKRSSDRAALDWFETTLDAIAREMMVNREGSGRLYLSRISLDGPASRVVDPESDYCHAVLAAHHGFGR